VQDAPVEQEILRWQDPSAGTSMGCLPQQPWGLFFMVCIPSPRKILNGFQLNNRHI
jgi:hypothetical protein